MRKYTILSAGTAALLLLVLTSTGQTKGSAKANAVVIPGADLKWTPVPGIPQVATAPAEGDVSKGPGHFFLRYAAGFATPVHHHTADHYVTLMAGSLTLLFDGKEQRLAPGSFFSFTGKAKHAARCEAGTDCVMFVDARAKWDVVPEATAKK